MRRQMLMRNDKWKMENDFSRFCVRGGSYEHFNCTTLQLLD